MALNPSCLAWLHSISEETVPAAVTAAKQDISVLSADQTAVLQIADNINQCLDKAFCANGSLFQAPNISWGASVLSTFVFHANNCINLNSITATTSCLDSLSEASGVGPAKMFSKCVLQS